MSPQIKYAYKTHNTWIYRRVYPKALQDLLGTALKQSLKTGDATQAKARVAELNQTFTTIIKEAQAHALTFPHTDTPTAPQGPRLAVGRAQEGLQCPGVGPAVNPSVVGLVGILNLR